MNELDVLHNARALIAEPKQWTKRTFKFYSTSDRCYCRCLDGALREGAGFQETSLVVAKNARYGDPDWNDTFEAYEAAVKRVAAAIQEATNNPGQFRVETVVWAFNDNPDTTHGQVLNVLDEAIVAAERQLADAAS